MYSAGKYWSGTRKIFAVCKISAGLADPVPGPSGLSSGNQSKTDHSLTGIEVILRSMDKKLNKTQAFLGKGSESVYKDISVFLRDMLKCPICYTTTKDKVPHATSCCNHVFCLSCVNELSARQDDKCPLCKQRRGPLYPILLSGMKELCEKVSLIPGGISSTDSD